MKFCDNCGQGNPDDATFCAQCGGTLGTQATTPEAAPGASLDSGAFTGGPGQPPPPPGAPGGPVAWPPMGGAQGSGQPPVGPPGSFPPPGGQAPFVPPPGVPPSPYYRAPIPKAETESMAIASLALGIAGFAFCQLLGILAVIFGYMARTKIAESGGRLQGDGMALAGIIMGWIEIGLTILGIAIIAIGVGVGWFEMSEFSLIQMPLVMALI